VLDNASSPDGGMALSSADACYAMYPPVLDVTRPAGCWNDVRIVAQGAVWFTPLHSLVGM